MKEKSFFVFLHTHIKRTIHVHFYKFVLHKRLHEIILKTLFSIFCIFSQQFMRFKGFGGYAIYFGDEGKMQTPLKSIFIIVNSWTIKESMDLLFYVVY